MRQERGCGADSFQAEGPSVDSRTGVPGCVRIKAMVMKRPQNMVT